MRRSSPPARRRPVSRPPPAARRPVGARTPRARSVTAASSLTTPTTRSSPSASQRTSRRSRSPAAVAVGQPRLHDRLGRGEVLGPELQRRARRRHHDAPQCADAGHRPHQRRDADRQPCLAELRDPERHGKCWGAISKEFSGAPTGADVLTPHDVAGGAGAIDVAPGWRHECIVIAGGSVKCYGDNTNDQLGGGNPTLPGPVSELVAGQDYNCVLVGNGVRCWGNRHPARLRQHGRQPDAGDASRHGFRRHGDRRQLATRLRDQGWQGLLLGRLGQRAAWGWPPDPPLVDARS